MIKDKQSTQEDTNIIEACHNIQSSRKSFNAD